MSLGGLKSAQLLVPSGMNLVDLRKRISDLSSSCRVTNVHSILFQPALSGLGTDADKIKDKSECTEEQKECARRRVRKSKA
jgi:hypothetical protein